jgi:hypothetical protein
MCDGGGCNRLVSGCPARRTEREPAEHDQQGDGAGGERSGRAFWPAERGNAQHQPHDRRRRAQAEPSQHRDARQRACAGSHNARQPREAGGHQRVAAERRSDGAGARLREGRLAHLASGRRGNACRAIVASGRVAGKPCGRGHVMPGWRRLERRFVSRTAASHRPDGAREHQYMFRLDRNNAPVPGLAPSVPPRSGAATCRSRRPRSTMRLSRIGETPFRSTEHTLPFRVTLRYLHAYITLRETQQMRPGTFRSPGV